MAEPKVKVRYTGKKARLAITVPFAARTKSEIQEIFFFSHDQVHELPKSDADKLADYDPRFVLVDAVAKPIVSSVPKKKLATAASDGPSPFLPTGS